jgi:hypothetical protein
LLDAAPGSRVRCRGSPPVTSPTSCTTSPSSATGTTIRHQCRPTGCVPLPQGRSVHPDRPIGRRDPRRRLQPTSPADGRGRPPRCRPDPAPAPATTGGARSEKNIRRPARRGWGHITGELRGQLWLTQPLGTFLRLFTFGHVRQLVAVAAGLRARLAAATRSCPTRSRWCSSTSTTPCARPTATPSRAPVATTPGKRVERAARGDLHTDLGAADRRRPPA